jgi:hypothetical protein
MAAEFLRKRRKGLNTKSMRKLHRQQQLCGPLSHCVIELPLTFGPYISTNDKSLQKYDYARKIGRFSSGCPDDKRRKVMKAYRILPGDNIDGLRLEDLPERELAAGEVRLRVHAVALNYRDLMVARGNYLVNLD